MLLPILFNGRVLGISGPPNCPNIDHTGLIDVVIQIMRNAERDIHDDDHSSDDLDEEDEDVDVEEF